MATTDTAAPGGRPIRIAFTPAALIVIVIGLGVTAWPSGSVGFAIVGLALLWIGNVITARESGPMIRFGGSFFLAAAIWAAIGFGFPASFSRWPAPDDAATAAAGGALTPTTVDDPKYRGLVALVATVRLNGGPIVLTNESTPASENAELTALH